MKITNLLLTLLLVVVLRSARADMDADELDEDSYTLNLGDKAACPSTIRFNEESNEFKTAEIEINDDVDCSDNSTFSLKSVDDAPEGASAPIPFFSNQSDIGKFLTGRPSVQFSCGPFRFAPTDDWIFVLPEDDIKFEWATAYGKAPAFASDDDAEEDVELDEDERYLFIGDKCFYKDTSLSDRVCFPADATVTLRDRSVKPMSKLAVGDEVHVGNGVYSRIFAWTHRAATPKYRFVQLTTEHGANLVATPGHYVYADARAMTMRKVRVGMSLRLEDGSASRVVSKRHVLRTGLYNPQTAHGDIVVDGVVTTTYTTAVEPELAHALLAPVRAAFQAATGLRALLPHPHTASDL